MEEIKGLVLVRKKCDQLLIFNIIIIIIGTVFISIGAFHTNLWFDETYSVAISNHSLTDIWNIGGNDVHPILYYILLKIISLIFGNNIIIFRIFPIMPVVILSILGITHIRKDFGEQTGILFSFLTLFLPIISVYALEIRMYTWIMLFVTVMVIYANRIIKNYIIPKNGIIFSIFSLASAYTHYYGLITAGVVNIILLVYLIKKYRINKSNNDIKSFTIQALIQIVLYEPWLYYFIKQVTSVGKGFWIKLKFPDTLYSTIGIQYRGSFNTIFGFCFAICLYIYIAFVIYRCKKEKINVKNSLRMLGLYSLIIIIVYIISFKSAILYPRYFMSITGILILFIADIMSKEKTKYITIEICIIIFVTSLISNIQIINNNYDKTNMKQIEYMKENIKENDIIIYSNIGNGSIYAINFPNNKQYFYNGDHWNVAEAYKAYSPQMETIENLDFLNNYKGRVWIVDSSNKNFYNTAFKDDENYKIIEEKYFNTKYPNNFDTNYTGYDYNLLLLEKNN